ncbi:MAG: tRNA (adenosine(37)-N6)-threonylcarbamoyltransferase complex dimerization subunit type 1 TsaB [Bacilli bacterium]|nr:tRNA (adenosine(37)-N6)-threonylcarbamoyltransferase complex dimerization subunit type 1 TsaB [Bacilli bacterium]
MRILYIDTSSSYLYTGIVEEGHLISEIKEDLSLDLSKVALPRIASMFEEHELRPDSIDKIMVVNGPGSFTGIRVGITIAKVYAWSLKIPIIPINGLEAMATSISAPIKVPLIDARRGYVYAAIYNNDDVILEPQHILLSDLLSHLSEVEDYMFITNNEIDLGEKKCGYNPNIETIVNRFCQGSSCNPHMVNPEYLKLTEAEESRM